MITAAWNTGRYYTDKGQRIAACYTPLANDGDWLSAKGTVTFCDVDRGIDGTFEVIDDITNSNQLKQATMRAYDNNTYIDAYVSKSDIIYLMAIVA